jgi:hypothetical protein
MDRPRITLTAKNEGLEYRDAGGVYRFNVQLNGDTWHLYLPGSKGDEHQTHHLSPDEKQRILPPIIRYLEDVKWFLFFGGPYKVKVLG